ncbi:Ankyrin repeat and SOCS box [Tritrichomonas musculus]|uniref:Ankyrin repeat and SOCS box n=1 Tax=Tritrichomonas musculus TaxID=1915356 RepID=A0ABR2KG48_9EUKA
MTAVANEDIDIVKTLLRAGAKTDDTQVLHIAILQNNLEIVDLLLKYGADPMKKNSLQKNAFDILVLPEQNEMEKILKNTKALPLINHDKRLSAQFNKPVKSLQNLFERLPESPTHREDPKFYSEIV